MSDGLKQRFARNISYAFIAQFFSMLVSVLMSLIVPKILGVEQFAYWQLFIFYTGYVGLFHFGLSDGIYLRLGGTPLRDMDAASIGSQMRLMMLGHLLLGAIVLAFVSMGGDSGRGIVWICTAVQLILGNIYWYLGFVFQAANDIKTYSLATVLIKISFMAFILGLILVRPGRFTAFAIAYLVSQFIGTAYILWKGRSFLFAPRQRASVTLRQAWENCRIGICLTLSNIASSLILGVGRIFVDAGQGLASFSLVSFSISLTNFFLQFIAQVSIVMFPMLRQVDLQRQVELYERFCAALSYLLCGILVLYMPMRAILELWLPQYAQSLTYLGILLPVCIFDGKMQMLYNTYLKVLNRGRALLAINLGAFGLSALLCAFAVFALQSVEAVVVAQVLAIAVRSLVANWYLSRCLSIALESNALWECGLTLVFILTNLCLSRMLAWIAYFLALAVYYICCRKNIRETWMKLAHMGTE